LFYILQGRNYTIPCRAAHVLAASVDNQQIISLKFAMGHSKYYCNNFPLLTVAVYLQKPAIKGVPIITITVDINVEEMIIFDIFVFTKKYATYCCSEALYRMYPLAEEHIHKIESTGDAPPVKEEHNQDVMYAGPALIHAAETGLVLTTKANEQIPINPLPGNYIPDVD